MSHLHHKITKGFDSGILTGIILTDLQKSFDTIDHNIFIRFTDETIKWYTSYLPNAKFIISIESANSDKASITCGLKIYTNDMKQAVDSEILLYTNDTCLAFQHRDIKTIEEHLNQDFSAFSIFKFFAQKLPQNYSFYIEKVGSFRKT